MFGFELSSTDTTLFFTQPPTQVCQGQRCAEERIDAFLFNSVMYLLGSVEGQLQLLYHWKNEHLKIWNLSAGASSSSSTEMRCFEPRCAVSSYVP